MTLSDGHSLTPLSLPALAESPSARVRILLGHARTNDRSAPTAAAPIALEQKLSDPVQVEIDGRVAAWGEAVVLDGKVAVRIIRVDREMPTANDEASA